MIAIPILFQAIRPKTLIASLSPIFIGTALAVSVHNFHLWVFLFTILTGLGIQITANVANDLYDSLKGSDTAERKGPIRVTQSGLMSPLQVKKMLYVVIAFTALCGLFLVIQGGLLFSLLVALALLFAVGYTAGPFPLAYLGIGEFFILIFFGPVATSCVYYLHTLQFNTLSFVIGIAPGLISCALLVANNLRDVEEDRKAQKKTTVVRFGMLFGKLEYSLSLCVASLIPLFLKDFWTPLLCAPLAIWLSYIAFKTKTAANYVPLLPKTAAFLTLFTLVFCIQSLLCS